MKTLPSGTVGMRDSRREHNGDNCDKMERVIVGGKNEEPGRSGPESNCNDRRMGSFAEPRRGKWQMHGGELTASPISSCSATPAGSIRRQSSV